jgi:hypothetical protein
MAEYKKTDLKSKLETDLADNSTGAITAKTIRNSMLHIVDSITPIVGSGTQNFFKFDLAIQDSGVTTANTTLNRLSAKWGTNSVSSIDFQTGNDTLNKGDGGIDIYTSSSGVTLGGSGRMKRISIEPEGQLHIYGSGVNPPLRIDRSHADSGVAMLVRTSPNLLAASSGNRMYFGHLDERTRVFNKRMTIDHDGKFGLGIEKPTDPVHVRASGNAIRYDVQSAPTNTADIIISKYKGNEAFGQDSLLATFGMGVDTSASGAARFFVGYDDDRKHRVNFNEAMFVMTSGGKASFGSLYPKEQLVVGTDLSKHTVASGDRALVVGAQYGNAELFIGSGNANTNISNFTRFRWNSSTKQQFIETRSNGITRHNQVVLDSTNNNIGFASSGVRRTDWRPLFNTHVYASGTTTTALENPMGSETAIYIGSNTSGSGDASIGNWSTIGYKATTDVLKVNNSGSFAPNHLTIDRLGHVGVNTDSPYDNFAAGTNYFHVKGNDTSIMVGDNASYSALRLFGSRSTTDTAYIQAGTSAADTGAKLAISRFDSDTNNISEFSIRSDKTTMYGNIALNDKYLSNDGGDEGVRVTDDGKVGINVASPTYELQLSSNSAGKPISSVWSVVSDSRVKTDVETIPDALDKIVNLRPVKFKYTHDFCHCHESGDVDDDTYYYNFIAQEVEVEFPEAVVNSDFDVHDHDTDEVVVENVKTLDAHVINVYLVKAVQELKEELDAAKARITELES